jgi:hypothetical protein
LAKIWHKKNKVASLKTNLTGCLLPIQLTKVGIKWKKMEKTRIELFFGSEYYKPYWQNSIATV